ncbi:MAG: ParA family protein [Paenibacillus macerans]|uniref:CobQ/CobB/MinD/ParA nucleotide binding domain protein n=1 Tax=Paenibacillus macerans TaxID=44252 RepID=A0A090YSB5_PAEMA|nr:ParA family protein [Paenibacillus macerans]KFN00863.1 cobQ/CobB/MinD/ParA nucleotide binding domain protein [Paenibacillus macerans]MBS5912348.1 ParA family protein [Paenibacillus macerans]MCY7556712.1 ParA family protein [Paenibacillus macerans]MDU5947964.1 ParA family protein [Paenibacillus macerans]MDU7474016.1 ParA family protein [Paenibacillus macerans]
MGPIRLVLAVQDEQYIEAFLYYARSGEFNRNLILTAFSRKEALDRYLEESAGFVDAVLGEAVFREAMDAADKRGISWIVLGEEGSANDGKPCVEKYQPLHLLLQTVLDYVRGGKAGKAPEEGQAAVIGVYSSVGGCGKTTVALNIARQLAAEGGKVFYLNLETLSSGSLFAGPSFREGQTAGLARLLYDLKAADDKRAAPEFPISMYAYRHPVLQGDTFGPLENINEMLEMERKDAVGLIEYIAGSGLYDAVIIDPDSYPGGRTEGVFERADQLVWLVTDEWGVMRKTGGWLSHLERSRTALYHELLGKTRFVLNKYTGNIVTELPKPGLSIQATLSFVPSWSQGSRQGELPYSPAFQRDVLKLCRELLGGAETSPAWEG